MHLLRNFNSAKVCEGSLGRGHPQEVDVDPQSQRMEDEGRVSSRADARINKESFLSHLKKKNTLFILAALRLSCGSWDLSWGVCTS